MARAPRSHRGGRGFNSHLLHHLLILRDSVHQDRLPVFFCKYRTIECICRIDRRAKDSRRANGLLSRSLSASFHNIRIPSENNRGRRKSYEFLASSTVCDIIQTSFTQEISGSWKIFNSKYSRSRKPYACRISQSDLVIESFG